MPSLNGHGSEPAADDAGCKIGYRLHHLGSQTGDRMGRKLSRD